MIACRTANTNSLKTKNIQRLSKIPPKALDRHSNPSFTRSLKYQDTRPNSDLTHAAQSQDVFHETYGPCNPPSWVLCPNEVF